MQRHSPVEFRNGSSGAQYSSRLIKVVSENQTLLNIIVYSIVNKHCGYLLKLWKLLKRRAPVNWLVMEGSETALRI